MLHNSNYLQLWSMFIFLDLLNLSCHRQTDFSFLLFHPTIFSLFLSFPLILMLKMRDRNGKTRLRNSRANCVWAWSILLMYCKPYFVSLSKCYFKDPLAISCIAFQHYKDKGVDLPIRCFFWWSQIHFRRPTETLSLTLSLRKSFSGANLSTVQGVSYTWQHK